MTIVSTAGVGLVAVTIVNRSLPLTRVGHSGNGPMRASSALMGPTVSGNLFPI